MEKNKNGIYTIIAFVIGSLIIPLTTLFSENHFKNKSANINEMTFNSKFVESIVARPDNLDQKIELARYYATVSTDKEVRKSWIRYLKILENDKILLHDSLNNITQQIKNLEKIKKTKSDSIIQANLIEKQSIIINKINDNSKNVYNPDTKTLEQKTIKKKAYIQYGNIKYLEQIQNILRKTDWIVPPAEDMKDNSIKTNEIRYFNEADKILANELKNFIDTEVNKFEIKKVNINAPQGQLEIWIKD